MHTSSKKKKNEMDEEFYLKIDSDMFLNQNDLSIGALGQEVKQVRHQTDEIKNELNFIKKNNKNDKQKFQHEFNYVQTQCQINTNDILAMKNNQNQNMTVNPNNDVNQNEQNFEGFEDNINGINISLTSAKDDILDIYNELKIAGEIVHTMQNDICNNKQEANDNNANLREQVNFNTNLIENRVDNIEVNRVNQNNNSTTTPDLTVINQKVEILVDEVEGLTTKLVTQESFFIEELKVEQDRQSNLTDQIFAVNEAVQSYHGNLKSYLQETKDFKEEIPKLKRLISTSCQLVSKNVKENHIATAKGLSILNEKIQKIESKGNQLSNYDFSKHKTGGVDSIISEDAKPTTKCMNSCIKGNEGCCNFCDLKFNEIEVSNNNRDAEITAIHDDVKVINEAIVKLERKTPNTNINPDTNNLNFIKIQNLQGELKAVKETLNEKTSRPQNPQALNEIIIKVENIEDILTHLQDTVNQFDDTDIKNVKDIPEILQKFDCLEDFQIFWEDICDLKESVDYMKVNITNIQNQLPDKEISVVKGETNKQKKLGKGLFSSGPLFQKLPPKDNIDENAAKYNHKEIKDQNDKTNTKVDGLEKDFKKQLLDQSKLIKELAKSLAENKGVVNSLTTRIDFLEEENNSLKGSQKKNNKKKNKKPKKKKEESESNSESSENSNKKDDESKSSNDDSDKESGNSSESESKSKKKTKKEAEKKKKTEKRCQKSFKKR